MREIIFVITSVSAGTIYPAGTMTEDEVKVVEGG